MQRDKTQTSSQRNTRSVDPDSGQNETTRNAPPSDATSLGSRGKKTLAMLKESRNNLNSPAAAKKWLTKEELLIEGEDVTATSLAQALMWIAAGERNMVEQLVDAIRAVALCLEDCGGREVVDAAVGEIKETAVLWGEEAKEALQKAVGEVVEEAKKKINEGGKKSWADEVEDNFGQEIGGGRTQGGGSYAQVLMSAPRGHRRPNVDPDYVASEELKRRKVLVDGLAGIASAAGGLTTKEVVEKANIALTAARLGTEGSGIEPSIDPKVVAARILENGGVILEFETKEAVEWLTDQEV